ncbi:MAG: type II toxin-antitoxin system HicA family toxin [Candidatus Didemnitutus sp.]|nr:type II toxin-antitoxin system HicA family toxin [Candidatus Didemnitutus sp.]
MKLPRDVSGRSLVKALCRDWGYLQVHQVGSHVILQTDTPQPHRISIPDHSPLRLGTFNAILRAVAQAKQVSKDDVLRSL